MNKLAIIENSRDLFKRISYNIRYGRKFKKFNVDKSFYETLIDRSKGLNEKAIFQIISKSKNQEDFENIEGKNIYYIIVYQTIS